MKKILFLFLLLIIHNIYSIELRTLLFSDYYGQIEPTTSYDSLRQRNYIRPEINLDLFDESISMTLSGEFYYDVFNEEQTPKPENVLREAYLTFYLPWGDIIIGQKFTNKGKVDVFSPLNIYNASYRELLSLDDKYQGNKPELTLGLNYYINDDSSIEFLYIPFPRSDDDGGGQIDINVDDISYNLDNSSQSYLLNNPNSFFLTYNRYSYAFDTQFTYGNYTDGNYNYLVDGNLITKIFNRVQTIGGAISTSLGSVAITEELALNITEDFNGNNIGIKNSDLTLNSQFTKTLFNRTYSQVNIIYQHIFNYNNDNELSAAINDIHLQPTDNILFIIGHLHDSFLREKLYMALNVGYFFSDNVYIAPRVNYTITDYITLETGIDMYTGKYKHKIFEEDLGGDNFFVRLKYEY